MPIRRHTDAESFGVHGSLFHSYLRTASGSESLCAWQVEIAPDLMGVAHRPSHEEVLLVLEGSACVTLDGNAQDVGPSDVVHVPAGSELRLDGGPSGAALWVTTTSGLEAVVSHDGSRLKPPWAQ